MKLPPLALTAPSLCPRCDSPAMFVDECAQCALPLRLCGACLGVAGPFDRYCGFCGHELVLGRKASPARRLWLLAGLVPILVALGLGLSPLGQAAVRGVQGLRSPAATPAPVRANVSDRPLGFSLAAPKGWTYTSQRPAPTLGVLRTDPADIDIPGPDKLAAAAPKGAVVLLGRPAVTAPGVDANDPVAVLAYVTAQLSAAPPAGFTFTTVTPVEERTVAGRRAAFSLLSVTGPDGTPRLFERVYVSSSRGLFLVEALVPPAAASDLRGILDSLRLVQ